MAKINLPIEKEVVVSAEGYVTLNNKNNGYPFISSTCGMYKIVPLFGGPTFSYAYFRNSLNKVTPVVLEEDHTCLVPPEALAAKYFQIGFANNESEGEKL